MSVLQERFDGELNTSLITDLYFDTKYISYRHHHDSYDQFLTDCVMEEMSTPVLIFENTSNGKTYSHKMKYNNVRLKEPCDEGSDDINEILFPEDFKTRFLSYTSRLISDVEQYVEIYSPETDSTETRVVHTDTNVTIGFIPVLTRSSACNTVIHKDKPNNECPYNAGGMFIIKGSEKIIIQQENIAYNRIFVFAQKEKQADKNGYAAKVYSKNVEKINSNVQIVSVNFKKGELTTTMSQLSNIPICIIFKALGVVTDKDIIDHITMVSTDIDMANLIKPSIIRYKQETWKKDPTDETELPKPIVTQEDAINYLISKISTSGKRFSVTDSEMMYREKREYLHNTILGRDFIPHMTGNDYNKACYLGLMCHSLFNYYLGRSPPDDRDSLTNKRIENTGILMGQNFKQSKRKMEGDLTKNFKKKNQSDENPINMIAQIKHTYIDQGLTTPLTNGTWLGSNKKGVAQMVHRYTYEQYTSIAHRVNLTQISASTKSIEARFNHNVSWGFYDGAEGPEHGQNVGTTKHMTITATITINAPGQPDIIKGILYDEIFDLNDVAITEFKKYINVFVNGQWIGITNEPTRITKLLKQKRTDGNIERQVSIAYNVNKKTIHINTDAGRLLRPVLRVNDNKLVLTQEMLNEINFKNKTNPEEIHTWTEFLMKYPETIDFVDPEEQETIMIAMWQNDLLQDRTMMNRAIQNPERMGNPNNRYDSVYKRYTHCEIHPFVIFGHVLANAKFTEHNAGPRNYFAFAQHKQGMGKYMSNYRHRTDLAYNLYHEERQLVYCETAKYTNSMELNYFLNPTVAILQYSGYNQEDSILANAGSISRGFAMAESFKKEKLSITKNTATADDEFKNPDKNVTTGLKDGANYDKLNEKGYVEKETVISNGDVLFGKVSVLTSVDKKNPEITRKDSSLVFRSGVDGVVDDVVTDFKNDEGYLTYSARIRQQRRMVGGDKLCCYTSDHDVLTFDGWKPVNKLTMNDKVACVKTTCRGNEMLYEYPLELQNFDYSGKLYSVKTEDIDLVVTPNHRMYVCQNYDEGYVIAKAETIFGKEVSYKKSIDIYNSGSVSFEMYQTLLETWTDYEKNNECFPEWVWSLHHTECMTLLDSIIYYDDNYSYLITFNTSSEQFANEVQRLTIHAGWTANKTQINNDLYQLIIDKRQTNCHINFIEQNDSWITFDNQDLQNAIVNRVYCCTMPYNGIVIVRRNGKVCLCGQSSHGQKGTIGYIYPEEDMPFTEEGIRPDLIINSCCIPTRMTVGQLVETVLTNYAAILGKPVMVRQFERINMAPVVKAISDFKKFIVDYNLENMDVHDYHKVCSETMYSGIDGKRMENPVFIGITTYLRLKHLVDDKVHARARGPMTALLKQPPEGRARDGGLRLGEMERDVLIAHGIPYMQKEKFMEDSDGHTVRICTGCGIIAPKVMGRAVWRCPACSVLPADKRPLQLPYIQKVNIPYAAKIHIQEMAAIGVLYRIRIGDNKYASSI